MVYSTVSELALAIELRDNILDFCACRARELDCDGVGVTTIEIDGLGLLFAQP